MTRLEGFPSDNGYYYHDQLCGKKDNVINNYMFIYYVCHLLFVLLVIAFRRILCQ